MENLNRIYQSEVKLNLAPLEIKNKYVYQYEIEINFLDLPIDQNNLLNGIEDREIIIEKNKFEIFKELVNKNRKIFERQKEINLGRLNEKRIKFPKLELQVLNTVIDYASKNYKFVLDSKILPKFGNLKKQKNENIDFDIGDLRYGRFGYHLEVKLTENGPYLCITNVLRIFIKGGRLTCLIEEFCSNKRIKLGEQYRDEKISYSEKRSENISNQDINTNGFINPDKIKKLNSLLKGVDFIDINSKKRSTISGLKIFPNKKLSDEDGKLFGNSVCVQVNEKSNPKYFPLEIVEICEDQCIETREYENGFNYIENQLKELIKNKADFLKAFGISIRGEFKKINGRILDSPNLYNNYLAYSYDIKWAIFKIGSSDDLAVHKNEINNLIKNLSKKTFKNRLTNPIINQNLKVDITDEEIKILTKSAKDAGMQFILFLIPNFKKLDHKIKFISECKKGIITECITYDEIKKISKMQSAIVFCENLLSKINLKLGFFNENLEEEDKVGFLDGQTMIMGLSVTFGIKEYKDQNNIVSLVATYNSRMINYHSIAIIQEKNRKDIVKLNDIFGELIEKFHAENDCYPKKFVVFRDNLNDNQFQNVMSSEIYSMKEAFRSKNISEAKITYIICQRMHNIRFLHEDFKSGNLKSGFLVDREIVSNFNEFYLCTNGLGISGATRYIVLYDESKFNSDQIQQATYNLSFLTSKKLKSASVPPVLYAKLAAKRTMLYISNLNQYNKKLIENYEKLSEWEKTNLNNLIKVQHDLEGKLHFI